MTVSELYRYLNEKIPPELSLDWDNDGLACCPDPGAKVRRVLVTLDPTEAVVDYAIREGYDVILTHHPLLFKGVKAVNCGTGSSRKLVKMIRAGVSAMAFHTRLDALTGGVNDIFADLLGIRDTVPFGADGEMIGRIGSLPEAMPFSDFCALVKQRLGAPVLLASDAGRPVFRVAVLGGEGGDDLEAAFRAGADTFVSGRLGYHRMIDAPEMGLNLIEAGHYFTEFPVCGKLASLVRAADEALRADDEVPVEVSVISSFRLSPV